MPQFKNASVQKILNEITAKKGWFEVDEFWTIKFNPLTAIFDGLSYVIKQLEVPEKYWNVEKQDYNPILYYVSQVDPTSMSVFVSDQVLQQYGVSGDASKVLFAAKCGVWNGLVGQVAGLADTAGLLSDLLTGGDRLGQVWEGVKKLDIFCTSSTGGNVCIWTIIKKAHQGNKYQVSHQIGKDISEVLTIVVSFAKAGKLAKISQVADALDPVNYVMRVSGKVIRPVLSATGKTFKFVLKEGVDFVKRLNVKVTPQGFGCGFPIVKINVTLKSKIDNLTDAQLTTKVEAEINTQGGIDKLPVDENGNRLVEIDVDGEKVPVIVGEDGNLSKVTHAINTIDGLKTFLQNKGWDTAKIDAIVNDINNSADLQDFLNQGKDFTREWSLLDRAGKTTLRKNKDALNKVMELLDDAKVRKNLGNNYEEELMQICKAQGFAPHSGYNPKSLVNHLEDVKTFFNKFDGLEDMGEMRNAMRNSNQSVQDGLQHTLTQMNKLDASSVKRFDMKFETEGLDCTNCRFDVELDPNKANGIKYLEYKSYKDASGIQLSQFKSYMGSIKKLSELNYIFNGTKLSLENAKAGLKTFFNKGNNKQEIFNAMDNDLRQSLNLDDFSDLTSGKIDQIINVIVKTK